MYSVAPLDTRKGALDECNAGCTVLLKRPQVKTGAEIGSRKCAKKNAAMSRTHVAAAPKRYDLA